MSRELVTVHDVEVLTRSDKALFVRQEGVEVWVPLSQIREGGDLEAGDQGTVVIPKWLAMEKELYYGTYVPRWNHPRSLYGPSRRAEVAKRFESARDWLASGKLVGEADGVAIGEFETEEQAAIAANAARIVLEVLDDLDQVHRWISDVLGSRERDG